MENSELISKETLTQLKALEEGLTGATTKMGELLDKSLEVTKEFAKYGISIKDLGENIKKYEKVNQEVNEVEKEQQRLLKEKAVLEAKVIQSTSQEALEVAKLREQMNQYNKTLRNQAKELNSVVGSTENLRGQLNQMLQTYEKMDKQMKKSPLGKDLKKQIDELTKSIKGVEGETGQFSRNVGNYLTKAGGTIAAFFGVPLLSVVESVIGKVAELATMVIDFTKEGVAMATAGEGIQKAFNQIADKDTLQGLREATKGTVTDLELMKSAVRAENFGIPLENLGSLLKFAQQRAQETGESVDYLVNSIITGIGRESVVVLDNLQIKQTEIRERTKKTGDMTEAVLEIVNEKLEEQGDLALTAADKEQIASVKRQNAQRELGEHLLGVKNIWSELTGSIFQTIADLVNKYLPTVLKRVEDIVNTFIDWYNTSVVLRVLIASMFSKMEIGFAGLKMLAKSALDGFQAIAEGGKAAFTFDLKGVADAQAKFYMKLGKNNHQFLMESMRSVVGVTTSTKNQLDKIDITSKLSDGEIKDKTRTSTEEELRATEAFRKAELKAEQDMVQLKLQTQIDAEKAVLANNKMNYECRLLALDEFVEKQKEKIEQAKDLQLSDKTLGPNQKQLIEEKAQSELTKIDQEAVKLREGILKDHISDQNKTVENGLAERNALHAQKEQEDEFILLNKFREGYLSQEEYDKERTKLTVDYAQLRLQSEIEAIQKMLDIVGISEEDKIKLTAKMKKAELDFGKSILDQQVDAEKEAAEKRKEIEKNLAEAKKKLYQEAFSFMNSLVKGHTDRQLNELDKQSEDNQKYRDEELDKIQQQEAAGLITKEQADAQKWSIDEAAKAREEQIAKEKREIQERQAKYEKASAIANIAINTAAAVMKNTATLGFLLALPINALTIAMGAMQAATIAAQPIPKYAKGTDHHEGGLAVVGDGGRHELIRLPNGELFKTPKTDTLVDLPKGSQVMPDFSRTISEMSVLRHYEDDKVIVIQENKQGLALAEKRNKMIQEMSIGIQRTNSTMQLMMSKSNSNLRMTK